MSNRNEEFLSLIEEIKTATGLTQGEIEARAGRSIGYISSLKSRMKNEDVPEKFIDLLKLTFKNYINGETQLAREPETNYLTTRRNKKNAGTEYLVPFVDILAQDGHTSTAMVKNIYDVKRLSRQHDRLKTAGNAFN